MIASTGKGVDDMEIRGLKVRREANLKELDEVIEVGHTVIGESGQGGWQMPASAEVGDLVIWYSGSPQQKFVAYGWVCGTPVKPEGQRSSTTVRCARWRGCREAASHGRRWARGPASWPTRTR